MVDIVKGIRYVSEEMKVNEGEIEKVVVMEENKVKVDRFERKDEEIKRIERVERI